MPYNFTHGGHKFTLRKRVDNEGNETENLDLDIDGLEFSQHPFVSSDFVLDEEKQLVYCAGLSLNLVEVFANGQSETWSASMLNQRILKKFGDSPILTAEINKLN